MENNTTNNTNNQNKVETYLLKNNQGDELVICNYGARMVRWLTKVNGELRNIILGFSDVNEYLNDSASLGAIVGPFANRIGGASFHINGKHHSLTANEGSNQLHGGPDSFGDRYWQLYVKSDSSITLLCNLNDGFNGYPGPISAEITYELTNSCECIISANITSEQLTAIGPTSHAYFNLAGTDNSSQSHQLQINAVQTTITDDQGIPTGEIKSIEGTKLNFIKSRQLDLGVGKDDLNNNFVINDHSYQSNKSNVLNKQATLLSPDGLLALDVFSNLPGIQIYTGRYLDAPFKPFEGICLEPQFFPDSPNKPDFPFEFTGPNNPLNTQIIYSLVK